MVGPPTPRALLAPNLSRREQLLALITCSGGALACLRGGPCDPEQTLDHDGEHLSRLSQLGANPSLRSPSREWGQAAGPGTPCPQPWGTGRAPGPLVGDNLSLLFHPQPQGLPQAEE